MIENLAAAALTNVRVVKRDADEVSFFWKKPLDKLVAWLNYIVE